MSKHLYSPPAVFGVGEPRHLRPLRDNLGSSKIAFYMKEGGEPNEVILNIMDRALQGIPTEQIYLVTDPHELQSVCRQSLRGVSDCYGAIQWNSIDIDRQAYNYTLRINPGLKKIHVYDGSSSADRFILPLQWAIDNAIANTSESIVASMPYTAITEMDRKREALRIYLRIVMNWLSPVIFFSMIGVIYHLTGTIAEEQSSGMTSLLYSAGVSPVTKKLAFHFSFSLAYLPGWILIALVIKHVLFESTKHALILPYHILSGLSNVSWSILLGCALSTHQLAGLISAIASALLGVSTIIQTKVRNGNQAGSMNSALIYTLATLFPPCNYAYYIQTLSRWEHEGFEATLAGVVPTGSVRLISLHIQALVQIIVFFYLACLVEQHNQYQSSHFNKLANLRTDTASLTNDRCNGQRSEVALVMRNVCKTFYGCSSDPISRLRRVFGRQNYVNAVSNVDISIQQGEILCLLGTNGSGKSTTLEMISGLQKPTSGLIEFQHNYRLGLCPQKNVLWDELTVEEHLEVWAVLRNAQSSSVASSVSDLLQRVELDLERKTQSKHLSGGQQRRLQLAMMFSGNTNICCIDEASSGLDVISRRNVLSILRAAKGSHTIIFTTHYLDEAEVLADKIAIMSKGTVKAFGTPVHLKESMGDGYRISLLAKESARKQTYVLPNPREALGVMKLLDRHKVPYRFMGPQLEDVFVKIADFESQNMSVMKNVDESSQDLYCKGLMTQKESSLSLSKHNDKKLLHAFVSGIPDETYQNRSTSMDLMRSWSPAGTWTQSQAMLLKRCAVFCRKPLPELLYLVVPLISSGLSTYFTDNLQVMKCNPTDSLDFGQPDVSSRLHTSLHIPTVPYLPNHHKEAAATFFQSLGSYSVQSMESYDSSDLNGFREIVPEALDIFLKYMRSNHTHIWPGGLYLTNSTSPLIAYRVDDVAGIFTGSSMMNLLDNLRFDNTISISTSVVPFQTPWSEEVGSSLLFVVITCLALSLAPAFVSLYPTHERISKVRAMQYSNGLQILPQWICHALFQLPFCAILAAALCATIKVTSTVLVSLEQLFVTFLFYNICTSFLAFIISLLVQSQLAAFAFTASYLAVSFLLYISAYFAAVFYSIPSTSNLILNRIHSLFSVVTPMGSLARALFLTFNQFGTRCTENREQLQSLWEWRAFGGPICYLVLQTLICFSLILACEYSSVHPLKQKLRSFLVNFLSQDRASTRVPMTVPDSLEVHNRPKISGSGLRVVNVSKHYNGAACSVKNVSFAVSPGQFLALIGPNGAGKTTMFDLIRGESSVTCGDIYLDNISIVKNRSQARSLLGVCPQFDAVDDFTVRETLKYYGLLRGIRGTTLAARITSVATDVGLQSFLRVSARKLSGGNKRKLSLAIALIGNPPILLLDEPSSGMDAFAKRVMWSTLKRVTRGKATLFTTHSMEEAESLASFVCVFAKSVLALGTTENLMTQFGRRLYLHLICDTAPHTSSQEMYFLVRNLSELFNDVRVEDRMHRGQIKASIKADRSCFVSYVFETLEIHKAELGLSSYSVTSTSLEEIITDIIGKNSLMRNSSKDPT